MKWMLLTAILVIAASAVWAQGCATCGQIPQVQCPSCVQTTQCCPQTCPEPCPTPCPTPCPCPQACCPCPAAVPASMGAGPAANLQCLNACNFDATYASNMYAHNSVIIAVTEYGMQRASDRNLRDISGEINRYLTSANEKLQGWYGPAACTPLSADCAKAQAIINELSCIPANCFDAAYAKTLSQLLCQSANANSIGGTQALSPQMKQQAQFLTGKEADWTMRLNRWVTDHT